MSRIEVTIDGGEELLGKLSRLGVGAKAALRPAVRAGATVIQDAANALAPGPHVEIEIVSASAAQVVAEIGPDAAHWHYKFFETGARPHEIAGSPVLAFEAGGNAVVVPSVHHPGMAAKPFLRPAHDGRREQATDAVGDALRQRIEQV